MRSSILKNCPYHSDCFANLNGYCSALDDVDFKGKSCPFYKTAMQNELDKSAAYMSLVNCDRKDLISKYYKKEI